MDLIILVIGVLLFVIFLWVVLLSAMGWFANKFFGKNEAWLDYGIDEDEM